MIPCRLRLAEASPDGVVVAWYLQATGNVRWLELLTDWPELPPTVQLAPIGAAAAPSGLLVLCAQPPARGTPAIPLQAIAPRILIPQAARVQPPATSDELRAALPPGWVLWLPDGAPWAIPGDALMTVDALLAAPALVMDQWRLLPPAAPEPRLRAIRPADEVDLGPLFNAEATRIGITPPKDLTPRAGEPGRLGVAGRIVLGRLGHALGGMADAFGASAAGRALNAWAERVGGHLDPRIMELRFAALNRLLDLLERDPNAGLEHAIPLGSDEQNQFRGIAAPSWQLSRRLLGFALGGRGGPIDPWFIPNDLQNQLRQKYLALGEAAIARGDFRRAASIYAQLLHDWALVARTLERGRLFREAAVIYRDRLKQPLEAGRCLERGGLLIEAAAQYALSGALIDAGRCWHLHGDEAKAEASYRQAIAHLLIKHDADGAAGILSDHLHAEDEALTLLADTWPSHPQAAICLASRFDLLTRLGRHPQVGDLLRDLRTTPANHVHAALPGLVSVVTGHPDAALRDEADDVVRCLAGTALSAGPHAEATRALGRLATSDRQLADDAGRFEREAAKRLAAEASGRGVMRKAPETTIEVRFYDHLKPLGLISTANGLLAFLRHEKQIIVRRIAWDGTMLGQHLSEDVPEVAASYFPLAGSAERIFAYLHLADETMAVPMITLPAEDRWRHTSQIGTFGPIRDHVVAACADDGEGWWLVRRKSDKNELVHCPATGAVRVTPLGELPVRNRTDWFKPYQIARLGAGCLIARGDEVLIKGADGSEQGALTIDGQILAVTPHPDRECALVVITTENSVHFVQPNDGKIEQSALAINLTSQPVIGFTRDHGRLIVGTAGELRVFFQSPLTIPITGTPMAITWTPDPERVVVLTIDGRIFDVRVTKP